MMVHVFQTSVHDLRQLFSAALSIINGAVLDGGQQRFVLFHGELGQGPGLGGQAHSVVVGAQGGSHIADFGPAVGVELVDSPFGRSGDALQSGGHNGVALVALVNVNADHAGIVGGSRSNDGGEHGAAAGEDHFGAVLIPAAWPWSAARQKRWKLKHRTARNTSAPR